jgi:hypothetical protein
VSYSWTQQNLALGSGVLSQNPAIAGINLARAINNGWIQFEGVENRLRADGYIEFGIISDTDASVLKREIILAARDPSLNDGYLVPVPKFARTAVQQALVSLISSARLDANFNTSKQMAGGN